MNQYDYPDFTGLPVDSDRREYVISPEDALTVDLAIKIGRPLLIEGEAGCGKTQLAYAIANEFSMKPPIIWPVRSSSRANDLFYRFDALSRLQDSYIEANSEKAKYSSNYIHLEKIGEAISKGLDRVILIDEVDKADMDFQNDLLFALERFEFPIDEIPNEEIDIAAKRGLAPRMQRTEGKRPIVLLTSNRERQLPKPFLRRCIYLELKFPNDPEDLYDIVVANLRRRHDGGEPGGVALHTLNEELIRGAVASFLRIRDAAELDNANKKPATAELLDWIHAMHIHPDEITRLDTLTPSFWQLLFRSSEDMLRHQSNSVARRENDTDD